MADLLTYEQMHALLPPRPEAGHKGTFGHVFVVAGSRGFTGAAKLACRAAERSGAGLVTLGIGDALQPVVAVDLLESMTLGLPSSEDGALNEEATIPALEFARSTQAVAIGPGLGTNEATQNFVEQFLVRCPVPFVADADALNGLAGRADLLGLKRSACILTPHPGEMARLLSIETQAVQAAREAMVRKMADTAGAVTILKGHRTLIAMPGGKASENPTGNHGLAKGGSGDVLTGLLGGLLAQGMAPFDAARLGVYVHGLAGDIAAARVGARGMTASDVLAALPAAWRQLEA
jgi:NAD(P)H-hydrate epimerase